MTSQKSSVAQILVALLVLGVCAPCFCCGGLWLLAPDEPLERGRRDPRPPAPTEPERVADPAVDLGSAAYPAGHQSAEASGYTWTAPWLTPDRYSVRYDLAADVGAELAEEYNALGRSMRFRKVGEDRIAFDAPRGCQQDLRCVYARLATRHDAVVAPIAAKFLARARSAGMSHHELAVLILTFVQHLRYQLPDDHPFGVLPPAHVADEGWGDCDSKALLAILLLRSAGISAAMLASQQLGHAAVGVRLPGAGVAFESRGRRYLYTEVTAEGWPIGRVPPKYDVPVAWEVVWTAD